MVSINKLISGNKYDIYAVAKNQECLVQEFIDELQEADRKKIVALLKRAADHGLPINSEKFRGIRNTDLWEFKSYQVRILCAFERERIIILTHGFIKKSRKTPKSEIVRAERLLKEYKQGRLWS